MLICFVMPSASRMGYGLFTSAVGATRALNSIGNDVRVVAGYDQRLPSDLKDWGSVPVSPLRLLPPRRVHYAPRLNHWFAHQPRFDVVSLHGVWLAMHATAYRAARRANIPVMLTPHGSLDPWALELSKAKKRLARLLYIDAVLEGVNCFHALNESEALSIRRLGLRAPIAIIPNGVDAPARLQRDQRSGLRKLLFIGRIHAKKGVRELLQAWAQISPRHPDWELVVAGPDEMHLTREYEGTSAVLRVRFVGEINGEAKSELLRDSDAFILPSFSEGMPIAVLEAWSFGLPVVMTRECNLPDGFAEGAAIEARPSVASIVETLGPFLNAPAGELAAIGERGRQLVLQRYSWQGVARELSRVYEWLQRDAAQPSSVHLD